MKPPVLLTYNLRGERAAKMRMVAMRFRVRLRDVVNHTDMGEYVYGMYALVEPHSARVFRATRL